jgi:AAA domain
VNASSPPLLIDRITVEEGFLDGLDLAFKPGLNVIIGPRGVGKTSVIELLRFCLGIPALTDRFEKTARDHARSVLSSGRVTVSCSYDVDRLFMSRRDSDEAAEGDALPPGHHPIVLSQNEIEAVGLDARGRLRIVDGFRHQSAALENRQRAILSTIASFSAEITELLAEIALLEHRVADADEARAALAIAEQEALAQEQTMQAATVELQQLDVLSSALASRSVRISVLERTIEVIEEWASRLTAVARDLPAIENWPAESGPDPLAGVQDRLRSAQHRVSIAENDVAEAVRELQAALARERAGAKTEDDTARELRRRVEALREGAGAAARRLAELRERVAQIASLNDVLAERRQRLMERQRLRQQSLDELEAIRQERFEERLDVARDLNRRLGPQIEIEIKRSGLASDYAQAIADALRGSGLHYSQLSPQLASHLPPHELVRAAEERDFRVISNAIGISADRAARVLEQIRAAGTSQILSAPVDDQALFKLLVGTDYRSSTELSTGQRCTAILPVLLSHAERPLIMDQPEDHLDTAFIVETLVRAMRVRPPGSQLIVSTHNPNIPVLGEASQVVVLGSDGRRGFPVHTDRLDSPEIVEAITSIMEGGREAFEQRADFYRSHPS